MHDHSLLLSYVARVYRDLAESAATNSPHPDREDVLQVVRSLKSSADQLAATWPNFSPPEAEAISDRLLAAACRSAVDGTLKAAEILYSRLARDVCAVPRPEHEHLIHIAYSHIGRLVESICEMYSAAPGQSQVPAAQEWKMQVGSALPLAMLRRWGPRAASDIAQRIGAVEQILRRRERAHEALFLAAHVLPSTDLLLHHAYLQAETAQQRCATYSGLLGDLVLLYSESNKSNHVSPQHKDAEATILYEAIQSRTTDAAQRLFHQLSPEQQQTAVDTTRASVAHSCDMLHRTAELPSAALLAQQLFDPAAPHPDPTGLPLSHGLQHSAHASTLQSLAPMPTRLGCLTTTRASSTARRRGRGRLARSEVGARLEEGRARCRRGRRRWRAHLYFRLKLQLIE